jgi:hypothetical protein
MELMKSENGGPTFNIWKGKGGREERATIISTRDGDEKKTKQNEKKRKRKRLT